MAEDSAQVQRQRMLPVGPRPQQEKIALYLYHIQTGCLQVGDAALLSCHDVFPFGNFGL